MKLFLVSLMLLFRSMYTLEAVDFKDAKNSLENIQEEHLSSNITMQTKKDMGQNDYSLTTNNSQAPTVNNSNNAIEKYIDYSDFLIDLSKTISSELAEILRKKMKSLLNKPYMEGSTNDGELKYLRRHSKQSDSVLNKGNLGKTIEEVSAASDAVLNTGFSKQLVESRQFVFHPYLPYGKETAPDEKISFQDVLPLKMVKFIKSMVEDAPWEAMFMKMVRMVVDQFVDKIIEKMFAHREEDGDKWRALNDEKTSPWSLLKKSLTSVVRLRRSVKSDKEASWDSSSFSQSNRLSKNDDPKVKETSVNESWLDSVLEFLFPDDLSEEDPEEYYHEERRKRDTDHTNPIKQIRMEDIIHTFLMKYLDLSDGKTPPEEVQQIVRASIPLLNVSESDNQVSTREDPKKSNTDQQSNGAIPQRWSKLFPKDMQTGSSEILKRARRSVKEVSEKEGKRLWQESPRSRPTSLKTRDECSLRKACNAGRLLSRLPSVQDLTLQLKEYGSEPHWDALLWGMAKKRCSKIFCRRQRSPKGSKHSWTSHPEKKFLRKHTDSSTHRYRTRKTHPEALFTV